MNQRKRRYKRWVTYFGQMDLKQLITVARQNGMQIIKAIRVGIYVHNSIALYGTPEAMKKTTAQWTAAGHEVEARKKSWYWPVNTQIARCRWVERELESASKEGVAS